jgi:hypothetical protein
MMRYRFASTPTALITAAICSAIGYVVRYAVIEPAEMGAICERQNPWWCTPRMEFIFFHQAFGLAYTALVLALLSYIVPARRAFPAVMGAMAMAGFGLILYNATGSALAFVLALSRSAWLDRRVA